MVSVQEAIKIGEVNYMDYKTEFFVMPQVKDYFEQKPVSLAFLLPEGWLWYESLLLESIDNAKEEDPEVDLGKNFKVIYTGIVENNPSGDESEDSNFNEIPEDAEEILFSNATQSVPNQEFYVKSITLRK